MSETIVLCCDVSGSMSTDWHAISRLDALKSAISALLAESNSRFTRYAIVAYSEKVETKQKPTNNFATVIASVNNFSTGGGTNIALGLRTSLAYEPNRIILISDGESDHHPALAVAETARLSNVKVDTIFVGEIESYYSGKELLEEIAKITNGVFQFCKDPKDLESAYCQLESRNYLQLTHQV
jgi:Mg-chelatase subunit ChlD